MTNYSRSLTLALFLLLLSCASKPINLSELMNTYANPGLNPDIGSPFNGAILVAKNGRVQFKQAYGLSNRERNIKNTVQTKFLIGSISKQFTSMLIMILVEEGKIKLNHSIDQYFPNIKDRLMNQITIDQLLSHTSGLIHYDGLPSIGISARTFYKTHYTAESLVNIIFKSKLLFKPGTNQHYSSLGYDVLGAIIEKITHKSYSDAMDQFIIKPLNLKNTGFQKKNCTYGKFH